MKVLLLGGTGAMGAHLTKLLESDNYSVFVTSRQRRASAKNITYLQGNAHELGFISEILHKQQEWDVIVDFMSYSIEEFVIRKQILLSSCRQYISISSARVYANCDVIDEYSPRLIDTVKDKEYLNSHDYSINKAQIENELLGGSFSNYTIIRPYITYAENRLQLGSLEKEDWLYRVLNNHSLVVSEDVLAKKTTLTYGFDVARTIRALIGQTEALGQIYNVTQSKSLTWQEILEIYLSIIREERDIVPNVKILKADPAIKTKDSRWQAIYDRLYDRVFDNKKLNIFIDTSTFTAPEVGLEMCLRSFLKQPKFSPISPGGTALLDRASKEWCKPSYFGSYELYIKYLLRRTILKN